MKLHKLVLTLLLCVAVGVFSVACGGEDDDVFCSLVKTVAAAQAPLPAGSHPLWLINEVNAVPPDEDGFFLRFSSDGTMHGNAGSSPEFYFGDWAYDVSESIKVHECGVGTRPPDLAGHWVYTSDQCVCGRFDVTAGVDCYHYSGPGDCEHHER